MTACRGLLRERQSVRRRPNLWPEWWLLALEDLHGPPRHKYTSRLGTAGQESGRMSQKDELSQRGRERGRKTGAERQRERSTAAHEPDLFINKSSTLTFSGPQLQGGTLNYRRTIQGSRTFRGKSVPPSTRLEAPCSNLEAPGHQMGRPSPQSQPGGVGRREGPRLSCWTSEVRVPGSGPQRGPAQGGDNERRRQERAVEGTVCQA